MAPAYIPPGMQRREEEPPSKRPRTEDSLIPEDMFLAKNRGPVTFTIVVPVVEDKPEWKLNGQMLSVTMPLTDTVSTLKTKIMEEVGMPQGKQKLQHENIFFKVGPHWDFEVLICHPLFVPSGREYSGLLQHDAWHDASAPVEGARREEEVDSGQLRQDIIIAVTIILFFFYNGRVR